MQLLVQTSSLSPHVCCVALPGWGSQSTSGESAANLSPQAWSSRDLCFHLDAWDIVTPDKHNDSLKFWLVL